MSDSNEEDRVMTAEERGERIKAGIAKAKAAGRKVGRPKKKRGRTAKRKEARHGADKVRLLVSALDEAGAKELLLKILLEG